MRRLWVLAAALLALPHLSGCDTADKKGPHTAQASAASAFVESAAVDGVGITLSIDPLKVGENRFVILTDDPKTVSVEAQVIMASMGHGVFVSLNPAAPGRYEAVSSAIDMNGRWLVRIKTTTEGGKERSTQFSLLLNQ